MKRILLLLFLATHSLCAGLESYSRLLVADAEAGAKAEGVRVTYLGTNGYQFESGQHVLLVDPYFSRISLTTMLFNRAIRPDRERISAALKHLADKADAIIVTHGHVDHLFDVPPIMQTTGARLLASPTAVELSEAAGAPAGEYTVMAPGEVRQLGPWKIRALAAMHDRVFPIGVPFPGPRKGTGPPRRPSDWVCGEPLAYLIETKNKRIYIDSGGRKTRLPPADIAPVDLAILGVALPDARARFAEAVRRLRPRYVLPSHQDNFFRPLDRGFAFGPLTDFPHVLREQENEKLPGQLILLDYFRPWTLP